MKTRLALKSKSLPVVAAVAVLAGGAVGHAQAPADQIVPFAADVKSLQVVLQPSGLPATLKFANSGNNVFYFPAVGIQNIEVRNGAGQYVPFTDAQGRLQIPVAVQTTILSVTLRDFLQDWELQNEILDNLETNSYVRQFAPIPVLASAAVQPGRVARLIFSDPAANNARRILGESLVTDADGNPAPRASFLLSANALALLRTAPDARNLSVAVDQTYRAQFRTTELSVMLQSAQDSLANVLRSLRSIPQGRPTYLLSPSLPLQMPGGWVGKDSSFTARVRAATKLEVLVRRGSTADPNLIDRMLSFAFNQANLAIAVSAQERQTAVATVLLDDDLAITLPIGRLDEVALDIRNDTTSKWSSAFISAVTKQQHTEVHGSADADVFWGLFGGSASADVIQDWSRSDYVNSKLDKFSQQLQAMSAHLSGDMMYVTGMSFSDAGSVQNVSFTEVEQNLTQFSVDDATLASTRSLMEYAQQLNIARQVETLLVPQVLAGHAVSPIGSYPNWPIPNGTARSSEETIRFERPFAGVPTVAVGINYLDTTGSASTAPTRIDVLAVDVREDQFTIRFTTWGDSYVTRARAAWIAVGQARVASITQNAGLAALANPGSSVPLIPAENREAVLQPNLSAPTPAADGQVGFSFNSIPGRTYDVLASTNLVDWASLGTTTASDFTSLFTLADTRTYPHRFFKVTTP